MSELDKALEQAQGVARRPVQERLHGTTGPDAEDAAVRLLTAAGLGYADAIRLASSLYWQGWNDHKTQTAIKEN